MHTQYQLTTRIKSWLYAGLLALMVLLPTLLTAQTPTNSFGFDNTVRAVIPDGTGGWYVGGDFTRFDTRPSQHEVLAISNATRPTSFPVVSGAVFVTIPDGAGGWYIGGAFTSVGGVTRNRLARINSDGSVHAFDANITADVWALVLSADGNTLYVGGSFNGANSVNGNTERNLVAAFTTNNGTVTGFNPNINSNSGASSVYTLALSADGSTLYVGGDFNGANSVNGNTTRNRLAAFTTNNGTVVSTFNPNMNGTVTALALSADGSVLYAGGAFSDANSVNGNTTRNRLAAFTTNNGTVVAGFDPNIGANNVLTLALSADGNILYAGGDFTAVNGSITRNRVAAFTTNNGTVVSTFDPNMNSIVRALSLSADGSILYVGGDFNGANSVNGNTTRNRLAAFTTNNGTVVSGFNPDMLNGVSALAVSGTNISIGGSSAGLLMPLSATATVRNRLARINSDGTLNTAFDPNMSGNVNALALSSDGSVLYAGGAFNGANSVNGNTTRNRLAAFTTNNGTVVSTFDPNMSSNVNALALSSDGSVLYAGGTFFAANSVNGNTTRNRLAAFTTNNGTVVSTFDPNISGTVSALALSSDGSVLYAGVLSVVQTQ